MTTEFNYPKVPARFFTKKKKLQAVLGWDCAISFLLYSIVKSQSLTPVIFMTKDYSDMSLCMGGKIRL